MGMDIAAAGFWLFLAVVVGSLIWRKTVVAALVDAFRD